MSMVTNGRSRQEKSTKGKTIAIVAVVAIVALGCATMMSESENQAKAIETMKTSFETRGIASIDRLSQDETQSLCSRYVTDIPGDVAKKIEAANLQTIKYPADGKLLGDWKEGEKVAQRGVGLQFSDSADTVNGANCYACHQLSPQELSYGSIGPSLYQYGRRRGNSEEAVKYTWGKIYNAEAYSACTNMPRFGAKHILTEQQIKDVVALLLDPNSPVNK
jgi:sulfur-oxidizing protein SoxX